ncbi:hypothetical protein [Paucibacter soli]|uniref:hypothetical protein n=1 Tax=Paucibacter soli TaxID=3133433 RepID=UPI00309EA935
MSELVGTVVKRLLAQGSKSEHRGMVLEDARGQQHVLRRVGGNPFRDSELEALEGRRLRLLGRAAEDFFLVERWEEAAD